MFSSRLDHLRKIMQQADVDAFLVSSLSNIFYISGFNRFLVDHDGFLLATQKSVFLITSPLYTQAVKKFTPDLPLLETSSDAWYTHMVKKTMTQEKLQTLGFEENDMRVNEYLDLQDEGLHLKSISLRYLRMQKDADEIQAIQKACQITDETFKHILQFIKEGVTEIELAMEMDAFVKSKGAEIGFPSIIAFGQHSAVPHHMTSDEKLQKNSFVLFDFGVKWNNYLSDMTRTVFFGKPTDEQKRIHETTVQSLEKAIEYIENHIGEDIFIKDVDEVSRKVIQDAGLPVYQHAGHGIGLEVHEAPTISIYSPEKLIEYVVFTMEPGIYLPDMGGVRIEDDFMIKDGKLMQLTHAPKELIVVY